MTTELRQRMITILSDDLYVQGWDQPNKTWTVMGDPDDEYLSYAGNFSEDPGHWFAQQPILAPDVQGLVLAYESWTYPQALCAALDGSRTVTHAFCSIVPPHVHPQRQQMRSILLVGRDGAILHYDQYGEPGRAPEWAPVHLIPSTGTTGDVTVDNMRRILNITRKIEFNSILVGELRSLFTTQLVRDISMRAQLEGWSRSKFAFEVYKVASPEVQAQLRKDMPASVREELERNERGQRQ